jgi:hypothetical protein
LALITGAAFRFIKARVYSRLGRNSSVGRAAHS